MTQTARRTGLQPLYEPRREMYEAGWLRILTPSAQLLLTALYARAEPRTREVMLDYVEMERAGLSRASVASALTELIAFEFVQDTGRRKRRRRVLFLTGQVPALSRMEQQALGNQWVRRIVVARVAGAPLTDRDSAQIQRRLRRLSRSPNQVRNVERFFLEAIFALPPGPPQPFREVLASIMPNRGDTMRDSILAFPSSPGPVASVRQSRSVPGPGDPGATGAPTHPGGDAAGGTPPSSTASARAQTEPSGGAASLSGEGTPVRRPLTEEKLEQLPAHLQRVVRTYNFHSPVPFMEEDLPALWEAYRQYTPAQIIRAIVDVLTVPDEPDLSRCKTDAQRETARKKHADKVRRRDRFTGEFAYFVPMLRMYGQSRPQKASASSPTTTSRSAKGGRQRDKHPSIQRSYPDRVAVIANLRRASQASKDHR